MINKVIVKLGLTLSLVLTILLIACGKQESMKILNLQEKKLA